MALIPKRKLDEGDAESPLVARALDYLTSMTQGSLDIASTDISADLTAHMADTSTHGVTTIDGVTERDSAITTHAALTTGVHGAGSNYFAYVKTTGQTQTTRAATLVVAANNSSALEKSQADYVCDGTVDNTEIQAAVTAAAGGLVYLCKGTYIVNGAITLVSNTTIKGAGGGTIIQLADSNNTDMAIITVNAKSNITISDMTIDANRAGQASNLQYCIHLSSACSNVSINRVITQNASSVGILLASGTVNCVIEDNIVQGCAQGIWIGGACHYNQFISNYIYNNDISGFVHSLEGTASQYITFAYNTVIGNDPTATSGDPYSGAYINAGKNHIYKGNTFKSNGYIGLWLDNTSESIVDGNIFDTNNVNIYLESAVENTISNNFSTLGASGVSLAAADDNVIAGNTFIANTVGTGYGIYLGSNSNENTIENNKIIDNDVGLQITAATEDDNMVSGNDIYGNSTNYTDNGTNTKARNNRVNLAWLADDNDVATHAALTTGVHGAGASTLATAANIATHAALTATHGVTGAIVGTSDSQELDNKTLDSSVAKGTWTASGAWTIPAVTLAGQVTGGSQAITAISSLQINTTGSVKCAVDNGVVYLWGGASGTSGEILLWGKSHASYPGQVWIATTNAAVDGALARVTFSGGATVGQATWTNCTQVYDANSLPNADPHVAGQLYYVAATGAVMRSAG